MTVFDPIAFRAGFPSLASGIAHFDGPGAHRPRRGSERRSPAPSPGRCPTAAPTPTCLGADPSGVVYGRGAAQITHDLSGHLSQGQDGRGWVPGDEVVVTRLDHDSNVRPWVQAAERADATVRWIDLDPTTAELDLADRAPSAENGVRSRRARWSRPRGGRPGRPPVPGRAPPRFWTTATPRSAPRPAATTRWPSPWPAITWCRSSPPTACGSGGTGWSPRTRFRWCARTRSRARPIRARAPCHPRCPPWGCTTRRPLRPWWNRPVRARPPGPFRPARPLGRRGRDLPGEVLSAPNPSMTGVSTGPDRRWGNIRLVPLLGRSPVAELRPHRALSGRLTRSSPPTRWPTRRTPASPTGSRPPRSGLDRAAAALEVTEDELLTRIERAGLEALLSPRSRARHRVRR